MIGNTVISLPERRRIREIKSPGFSIHCDIDVTGITVVYSSDVKLSVVVNIIIDKHLKRSRRQESEVYKGHIRRCDRDCPRVGVGICAGVTYLVSRGRSKIE